MTTAAPIAHRDVTRAAGLRERAAALAAEVADRLAAPDRVAAIATTAARLPGRAEWQPTTLHGGHPGIAVLHAALSTADPSRAGAARAHLAAAVQKGGWNGAFTPASVTELLPAALLLQTAHRGYPLPVRIGSAALVDAARSHIATHRARLGRYGPGLSTGDRDVVGGLAGTGRLLVELADLGDVAAAAALPSTLRVLVGLARPLTAGGTTVPGWWSGTDRRPTPDHARLLNDAGLASGLAGPLATLAIAHRRGHRAKGLVDGMWRITDWLVSAAAIDEHGPSWPSCAPLDEPAGTRATWCHGTAGVARALQLAGQAVAEPALTTLAVQALRGATRRPWPAAELHGPTLRHGTAGLLQATTRAVESDPDPRLAAAADQLAARLLDAYDPAAPFGFRRRHDGPTGGIDVDDPGLLAGAAGVALALAGYARLPLPDRPWDAALLLS